MIRLFLADIDGCLAEPYQPFDLGGFGELRAWGELADMEVAYPVFGICSGRAYPYVEATAQALGLRGPALFESGAGRFDLRTATIRWSDALTAEVGERLAEVRRFFEEELVPRGGFNLNYAKRGQVSIVTTDQEALAQAVEDVERYAADFPDLMVAPTHVSIDVVPHALTKRAGIEAAARDDGLAPDEVAFIGDSRGDVVAMEAVGLAFAPANAQPEAKAAAGIVTEAAGLAGVMEAYRHCVRLNESALRAA